MGVSFNCSTGEPKITKEQESEVKKDYVGKTNQEIYSLTLKNMLKEISKNELDTNRPK
jgi:hypothetical protein